MNDMNKTESAARDFLVRRKGDVIVFTMNRPDVRNAMSEDMRAGLMDMLDGQRVERDARAIIITGSGGSFCAGADLDPATIMARRDKIEGMIQTGLNRVITMIRDLPMPVIAAVDGAAAGAGLGLALAADFILVSDRAQFHLAFSRIGASPDGGVLPGLINRIGTGRATALAMLGGTMDAKEALATGIAHAMHPHDRLQDEAEALADKLAAGPTVSYAMIKRIVNAAAGPDAETLAVEAACQQQSFMSGDFAEGVSAFTEKRKPQFRGQ